MLLELHDSILKDFADAVNGGSSYSPSDSQHLYATVVRLVGEDLVYVKLNGGEVETPAKKLVEVGVGDLVLATMKGHTLTIIGNVSYPALTRVGPIYMTLTTEGLLIGKLDSTNRPVDGYIIIGTNGSKIYSVDGHLLASFGSTGATVYNSDGDSLASFGATARVGKTNASHVVTTSTGVEIRNGSNKILADFTGSGITLRDSNGTTIASFKSTSIEIGKSTSATISFCDGKAVIALDGTTLRISGGNSVGAIGISNSYGTYKSEVVCQATNNSKKAALQVLNGSTTVASMVLSSDGANVTVPSGKALSENGKEVVKIDGIVATGTVSTNTKTVTPGTDNLSATITPPTGYKVVGISGWYVNCSTYPSNINVKSVRMSGSTLQVYIENDGEDNRSISITAYWFAIRTSGITAGGSQSISW